MSRLFPGRRSSTSGSTFLLKKSSAQRERVPPPPEKDVPNLAILPPPKVTSQEATPQPSAPSAPSPHTLTLLFNDVLSKQLAGAMEKIDAALPCNSGNSLNVIEADIPTERSRIALIKFASQHADLVVLRLCEFLEKIQKRVEPGDVFSEQVMESQLYILKTLSEALDTRWPFPPSECLPDEDASADIITNSVPIPPTFVSGNGNAKSDADKSTVFSVADQRTRFASPKASSSSLRSTATSVSWTEPTPLDDTTVEYALDVLHMYLTEHGQFGKEDDSLFPWKVQEWDMGLMMPVIAKKKKNDVGVGKDGEGMRDGKECDEDRNLRFFDPVVDMKIFSKYTVYCHEETIDEELHGSFFTGVPILIRRYAHRILYVLSAANWNVVFNRFKTRIRSLTLISDPRHPYNYGPGPISPIRETATQSTRSIPASAQTGESKRIRVVNNALMFTLPIRDQTPVRETFTNPKVGEIVFTNNVKEPDLDLKLLRFCLVDKVRLTAVLKEYVNSLRDIPVPKQENILIALRGAILSWIKNFPEQYHDLWDAYSYPTGNPEKPVSTHHSRTPSVRNAKILTDARRRVLDGQAERLFDMLREYSKDSGKHCPMMYPTLSALLAVSPDKFESANHHLDGISRTTRKDNFLRALEHALSSSSGWDMPAGNSKLISKLVMRGHAQAASAFLDLINFAWGLQSTSPGEEFALQMLGPSMASELKRFVLKLPVVKVPFYASPEPIDVNFYAYAMAGIFRFHPQAALEELLEPALAPQRSFAVKLSAIKALTILVTDKLKYLNQPSLDFVFPVLTHRLRGILMALADRKPEIVDGSVQHAAALPISKRLEAAQESDELFLKHLNESIELYVHLVTLTSYEPRFFLHGIQAAIVKNAGSKVRGMVRDGADPRQRTATAMSMSLTFKQASRIPPESPLHKAVVPHLELNTSLTLRTGATMLLSLFKDKNLALVGLRSLHLVLEELEYAASTSHAEWHFAEPVLKELLVVEIALLNAVTYADLSITKAILRCLRVLCILKRNPAIPLPEYCSEADYLKRYAQYEAMSTPGASVVGQAAFQKRIRKYTQSLSVASPARSAVFRLVFQRVLEQTENIKSKFSNANPQPSADMSRSYFQEWRNGVLYVSCAIRQNVDLESDGYLANVEDIFPKSIPLNTASALAIIKKFLHDIFSFLEVDDVIVRETAREALASELNLRALPILLETLDDQLAAKKLSPSGTVLNRQLVTFVEQVLGILGILFERIDSSMAMVENHLPIHLIEIGRFLNKLPPSDLTSLRLRLRYCNAASAFLTKRQCMAIRDESGFRARLCDILADWLNQRNPKQEQQKTELGKIIRDVRIASVKLMVLSLEHLRLPATGESASPATRQSSSRRAHLYITTLLGCLPPGVLKGSDSVSTFDRESGRSGSFYENEALLHELVVSGTVHILNNNSEMAKTLCIARCYDDNLHIRVIFMKIFTRVLNLGVKFDRPCVIAAAVDNNDALCKLIRDNETLSMSMVKACPPGEVETLLPVLIRVFNTHDSLLGFLKLMITKEISETDSPKLLLRATNLRTRMLSVVAYNHGYLYLRMFVKRLIYLLHEYPPDCSFEVEVSKLRAGEDVARNIARLTTVTQKFIQFLRDATNQIPTIIREICGHISAAVSANWPESKLPALGVFFFLRFIGPAIVTPDSINIVIPDDAQNVRRALVLVAKVIQIISNQTTSREHLHADLAPFIQRSTPLVADLLAHIPELDAIALKDESTEELYPGCDEADFLMLRRFVDAHSAKIGQDFLDVKKSIPENESSSWKETWDSVTAMLLDSRTAMERPKFPTQRRGDHAAHGTFLLRNHHRNTETHEKIFAVDRTSEGLVFAMYFGKIEADVVDYELLLYTLFKKLSDAFDESEFDVIFDFTGFTPRSRLPIPWLKRALGLLPVDIQSKWRGTYLLNTSGPAQSYLRQIYCVFSGLMLSRQCFAPSSVAELRSHFPIASAFPQRLRLGSEESDEESFPYVHYVADGRMWKLGSVHVGSKYARVVSAKAEELSPTTTSHTVEVINFQEVEDIHKSHESRCVILRYYRGFSITFELNDYETLWRALTDAKDRSTTLDKSPLLPASETSDTTATLLTLGLMHSCHEIEFVRGAAYELLAASCAYLSYPFDEYIPWRGGFIPGNLATYILSFCSRVAQFVPQLTLDFILEWHNGFMNAPKSLKLTSIDYMRPWIKNLDRFTDPSHRAKLKQCLFIFVEISMMDDEIYTQIQRIIWPEIGLLQSSLIVDLVIEKVLKVAMDHGLGSLKCDQAADILLLLSSVHCRIKVLAELRSILSSACKKRTQSFMEVEEWSSLTVLTRLALASGHHPRIMSLNQLCAPDIAFLITMLGGLGTLTFRNSTHGMAVNLVQTLLVARAGDENASLPLRRLADEMKTRPILNIFGLDRPYPSSEVCLLDHTSQEIGMESVQKITELLVRILDTGAQTTGLNNVWKARWTSHIFSVVFEPSTHGQARGFIALSTLMQMNSSMEDEIFRKMLSICGTVASEMDRDMAAFLPLIRCIRRAVPALATSTDLMGTTFWLAVSILQAGPTPLFEDLLVLIQVIFESMSETGIFQSPSSIVNTFMSTRDSLRAAADDIDALSGLSFECDFGFALVATMWNGVKTRGDLDIVRRTLKSLLNISLRSANPAGEQRESLDSLSSPLFLGLAPCFDPISYCDILRNCNVVNVVNDSASSTETSTKFEDPYPITCSMLGINTPKTALLAINFLWGVEDYPILETQPQENVHFLWWVLSQSHRDIFIQGIWHGLTIARESWVRTKMDSFFSTSSEVHLKTVVAIFEMVLSHSSLAKQSAENITPNGSFSSLTTNSSTTSFISSIHNVTMHGKMLVEYGMHGILELYRRAHKPHPEQEATLRKDILKRVEQLVNLALGTQP